MDHHIKLNSSNLLSPSRDMKLEEVNNLALQHEIVVCMPIVSVPETHHQPSSAAAGTGKSPSLLTSEVSAADAVFKPLRGVRTSSRYCPGALGRRPGTAPGHQRVVPVPLEGIEAPISDPRASEQHLLDLRFGPPQGMAAAPVDPRFETAPGHQDTPL